MSDILTKIIHVKKQEVEENRELIPIKKLEKSNSFSSPCVSLKKYVTREKGKGVIAEIKRQSPSKGVINNKINVEELSIGYMQAGAAALSVLTDSRFFGGSNKDLITARKFNYCPILRKDFVIDEYQIFEAKSFGADAILLIEKILTEDEIITFTDLAHQLGMEVLLEIDSSNGINKLHKYNMDLIGVNNRNLNDFSENIETSIELVNKLPKDVVKISESGIKSADDALRLGQAGFDGFLIGEYFMRESKPEKKCREFLCSMNGEF